nr:acetyltransferase [uncultured Butyrivibrio sp.]
MNKLVLIGGGGHCKSVLDAIYRSGGYEDIIITDPFIPVGTIIMGCKVVGSDDVLPDLYMNGYENAFVTVGSIKDCSLRVRITEKAKKIGYKFPVIVDPSAQISKYAVVEEGSFLAKNVVINAGGKIGKQCIINTGAIIEHDCSVNDYSHVSVGAILCGDVHIGKRSFVGAGTVVVQGVCIGDDSVIGARSIVLADVSDKNVHGVIK